MLDAVFHHDLTRLRSGHGPEDIAVVKHMAMNLMHAAKPITSLKTDESSLVVTSTISKHSSVERHRPIYPIPLTRADGSGSLKLTHYRADGRIDSPCGHPHTSRLSAPRLRGVRLGRPAAARRAA